jgi:broad specificity phosphatase PhoE
VTVEIIFETHSKSVANEAGIAAGWRDVVLSEAGREQASELGARRRGERVDAVFCSDLRRAVETANIAFGKTVPIRLDRRLRELDYGTMTGSPGEVIDKEIATRVDVPFPDGESLRNVVDRVHEFLVELAAAHNGKSVVLIGHRFPKLALDHLLNGLSLEELASARFEWQPGWRYVLP